MKFKSFLLSASAVSALVVPAFAQEPAPVAEPAPADAAQEAAPQAPPALKEILKNVPDLLDKKWSTSIKVQMTDGEAMNGTIDLGLKYQDMKHFVVDVAFNMTEGEQTQKGTVKIVGDGEWVYLDGELPPEQTGGMPLPIKVQMSLFEQLLAQGSEDGAKGTAGVKKMMQEQLTAGLGGDTFKTFKEEGSTETERRFVFENEEAKGWITFGKNMWLPKAMEVSGDGNVMKMSSTGSKFVEAFPEGTFVFTVPEGKSVMDMTPMLQGMVGPPPSAGDEDLEF